MMSVSCCYPSHPAPMSYYYNAAAPAFPCYFYPGGFPAWPGYAGGYEAPAMKTCDSSESVESLGRERDGDWFASFPYDTRVADTTLPVDFVVKDMSAALMSPLGDEHAKRNEKDSGSVASDTNRSGSVHEVKDGYGDSDCAAAEGGADPSEKKKKRRRRKNKVRKDPRLDPNYWVNVPSAADCCIVPVDDDPLPLALIASM